MCNKVMYDKIDIFDLFWWNMKKYISWINKKIKSIFEIYNCISLITCPYFSLIIAVKWPKKSKASKIVP